ncbi:MAG TPA: hypothetical protein VFX80_06360 [Solirubrobacteraceae bacterium]|nr:hypothetical protein [Solirubrobacteraceae bacterium]
MFFLDEATALAAGHRPCAECRREDYRRFLELWPGSRPSAPEINARLHAERLTEARTQRHHERAFDELPDGAFVLRDDVAWLVLGRELLRWTPAGYTDAVARPTGHAVVVTPPSLLAVLERGWQPTAVPLLHPSAQR